MGFKDKLSRSWFLKMTHTFLIKEYLIITRERLFTVQYTGMQVSDVGYTAIL